MKNHNGLKKTAVKIQNEKIEEAVDYIENWLDDRLNDTELLAEMIGERFDILGEEENRKEIFKKLAKKENRKSIKHVYEVLSESE